MNDLKNGYKICKYRNCINKFTPSRSDQKFCSVQCKRCEMKYNQRENKVDRQDKENINELIKSFEMQELDKSVLELYGKIYSK